MPDRLCVNLEYAQTAFEFEIYGRMLTFGSAGEGRYYWMDGRQFRQGQGGPHFRPCVDLWWAAVEAAGAAQQLENEINRVLAECYPHISTARSMQDIYVDAHLYAAADREYSYVDEGEIRVRRSERTYLLADEECARLREIAHTRDSDRVRQELESLFLGELPPDNELPAFQEAAQAWIGNGITTLRQEGLVGLQQYARSVEEWIRKLRRRGGQERVRLFLNMFSYQCKVAFYLCYASAWGGILQRLREMQPPNVLGERFMRLWHAQNQPDELHGARDVFCGQVLALHPLSAVMLTSPEHLEVIGRWIGHPQYEACQADGTVGNQPEYWDLVASILIAAHEYDHSRRHWNATRREGHVVRSEIIRDTAQNAALGSPQMLFEEYAASRGIVCPQCAERLQYVQFAPADPSQPEDERQVTVEFRCPSCGQMREVPARYEDLRPDDTD